MEECLSSIILSTRFDSEEERVSAILAALVDEAALALAHNVHRLADYRVSITIVFVLFLFTLLNINISFRRRTMCRASRSGFVPASCSSTTRRRSVEMRSPGSSTVPRNTSETIGVILHFFISFNFCDFNTFAKLRFADVSLASWLSLAAIISRRRFAQKKPRRPFSLWKTRRSVRYIIW